ncbi:DENN domain-containing protein Crag isoform X5 [Bacillus rossius redtenbacheri]|uniref:DENN domain-containing protein Crag isoform X5 n=1 Tax=Bacillus rossius redtenbacheri TaxID=93214 RepID=UPI002FDEC5B2
MPQTWCLGPRSTAPPPTSPRSRTAGGWAAAPTPRRNCTSQSSTDTAADTAASCGPTGMCLLPAGPSVHQQAFESSAGLLMTHQHDSAVLWEETDSFSADTLLDSPAVGARKSRNRSGSCSEFVFGLRGQHCPTSPQTGRSPDTGGGDNWRQLMRSESFANDARILDNLNRLKAGLSKESVLANGRAAVGPDAREHGHSSHRKGSISRALFGRKSSLGLRHSRESSSENLEERSSTGSTDDLDSEGSHGSRRLPPSKLFSVIHRWGGGKKSPTGCELSTSPERGTTSPTQKMSPVRTPVTENDPLGALETDSTDVNGIPGESTITPEEGRCATRDMPEASERPLLFGRGVSRSATFGADQESGSDGKAVMQRSSTMPVDSPAGGFKLPFSRFSPARLSLKTRDLRAGTHIIENAIANFSPSSLASKKSNELLQGGLSSLKSAATSVAKKFDEIKEAMSVTSTPVKANAMLGRSGERESVYSEGEVDVPVESVRRISNEFSPLAVHMHLDYWGNNFLDLFGEGSRKGSASNLQPLDSRASSQQQLFPENIYSRDASVRDPLVPVALEVLMTSCSKCHNCGCVLYDEEIMAGWEPEDSNLNTKCQFCSKATVPFLSVNILDYRGQPMVAPSASRESVASHRVTRSSLPHLGTVDCAEGSSAPRMQHQDDFKEEGTESVALEPIVVPYLNPLVLRKELENILHCEGDVCLTQACFVDQHPIIYWNMVWVFQRTDVVSHLPGLCLHASTVNRAQTVHASWSSCDQHNVAVRCLWDNACLHEEVGPPMYVLWQQQHQPQSDLVNALVTDRISVSRTVMQSVVASVRGNDLQEPLRRLAMERHKLKGRGVHRTLSLYREILFLAFTAMGRKNIDQAAFDREYMSAYEKLSQSDLKLYSVCDRPLSMAALCCRHFFKELEL